MRPRICIATIVMCTLPIVATARHALAQSQCSYPLPVTGAYISEFAPLDTFVQKWVQANYVSAATLAVEYDKMLVYERGFGYQDSGCTQQILPDARMRLATNSTPMTRRALQQLILDYQQTPPPPGLALTATTNVRQYLNQFFSLPANPSDPRLQQIRIEDIFNETTCTSDANYITNIGVGQNKNLGRPATAVERVQYMWANPQYLMNQSPCTVGSTNGFSHVSHEIAAVVIALAYWQMSGSPTKYLPPWAPPNELTCADCVGTWFGWYINQSVGPRIGAWFFQAGDIWPGSPGSAQDNEIWYDSGQLGSGCAEWNWPACNLSVPAAYTTDYFARPGSGTIVSSARDYVRFMASYDWAGPTEPLSNSRSWLHNNYGFGCCDVGDLPSTTTLAGSWNTTFGGQYHLWNWALLVNRQVPPSFDLTCVLDSTAYPACPNANGSCCSNSGTPGILNTFQPTTDLYTDYTIENRWINQYMRYDNTGAMTYQSWVPNVENGFFPYSTLAAPWIRWRIQPDPTNPYYRFINEAFTNGTISNQDNLSNAEYLTPVNKFFSEEWQCIDPTSGPVPCLANGMPYSNFTQLVNRDWNSWDGDNGLNVQGQTGFVQQGPIQSYWWSADWTLSQVPSGLCCTNLNPSVSCPVGSTACVCGATGCPAYTP